MAQWGRTVTPVAYIGTRMEPFYITVNGHTTVGNLTNRADAVTCVVAEFKVTNSKGLNKKETN